MRSRHASRSARVIDMGRFLRAETEHVANHGCELRAGRGILGVMASRRLIVPLKRSTVVCSRESMPGRLLHKKQQFRLVLCGHKAVEAGAVCMILMVQGHLAGMSS